MSSVEEPDVADLRGLGCLLDDAEFPLQPVQARKEAIGRAVTRVRCPMLLPSHTRPGLMLTTATQERRPWTGTQGEAVAGWTPFLNRDASADSED